MFIVPALRAAVRPSIFTFALSLPIIASAADYTLTEYAAPPQVSWPTALSAAPNGDLYISSDQNGSVGHKKHMGKVIRCRDTNNDGKADEFINFIPDIDSPRGGHLVGGSFYIIHPPYLSVYRDTNGDGVADEHKQLVDGLGGGIEHPRGADHTTNSARMGIDGWLYIAVGDFGMFDAKGTDGKVVPLWGGGVARVRPDGSELETYAIMTRNNVDIAISPELDLFSRDNTNDGKGWNTRFHHFTNLGNHGYPRLYKNFANEAIIPIDDYGGGSGTGALWLDEPGFPPQYTNTLFTCDWTTGNIYHHAVTREFASFTTKQDVFLKLPRAIDIDVDGFSRLYIADWRDGRFNHSIDNKPVGMIHRMVFPGDNKANYKDVTKANDADLLTLITSDSAVQRLEASREIISRGEKLAAGTLAIAKDSNQPIDVRVAAIFTYKQTLNAAANKELLGLVSDAAIKEYALRALADRKSQLAGVPASVFTEALTDSNPRVVLQALIGIERLADKASAGAIISASKSWNDGGVSPRLLHTATTVLAHLEAVDACLPAVNDDKTRTLALRALQQMHRPDVVSGLILLAQTNSNEDTHFEILRALARLAHKEQEWDRKFWWRTRPDDRGPYYFPEAWSETPKIMDALADGFARISKENQGAYLTALAKNRIEVTKLKLPGLDPVTAAMGLTTPTVDQASILIEAAKDDNRDWSQRVAAYKAICRVAGFDGTQIRLQVLATWSEQKAGGDESHELLDDFINETARGDEVKQLNGLAKKGSDAESRIAWMSLLTVLHSPLAKDKWQAAVQTIIDSNPKEVGFFQAISELKMTGFDKQITAALASDNRNLVAAAKAAKAASTSTASAGSGKIVGQIGYNEAFAAAMAGKGDPAVGKRLFTQQGCIACHATDLKAEQKGPYLGAAGAKFTRDYLIDSVLDPNKVVAQGFQTVQLTMNDGSVHVGFLTSEQDGIIDLRNIAGQVSKLKRADVQKEDHLPMSMMPPGLANMLSVEDFTSLIDYLVTLKNPGG